MKRRLAAVCCFLFAMCMLFAGCDYTTYPGEFDGSKWRAVELDMVFEVSERFYSLAGCNAVGVWERFGRRTLVAFSFGTGGCTIRPIDSYAARTNDDGTIDHYIRGDLYFFKAKGIFDEDSFVMNLSEYYTRRVFGDDIPLQLTFIRVDGTPRDHDKWFKSEPAVVLPDRREERA